MGNHLERLTGGELESVLETVPFYVTLTDLQGVITYISRTYPGVTREQVVGTHLLNWLPPDSREPMQQAYARVLAGEAHVEFVGQGSGPDGPAYYRSRLGALKQDGVTVAVVVVGEDVTELKRAEERARRSARLEAIGQVTSAIVHDFGNLLTAMCSQVELLRLEFPTLPPPAHELVDQLDEALTGARAMTRDIVRAVQQRSSADSQLDLVSAIHGMRGILQASAGRAMHLAIHSDLDRAVVAFAPHELQQLLINLIVNSREATRSRGHIDLRLDRVEVGAEASYWPGEGTYVRIQVLDDGPGIAPEDRDRVLQPFVTTKPEGGGLGLATCLSLARARGGDLRIEASESGGTAVVILLPLLSSGPDEPAGAARMEPDPAPSWTILFAEDDDLLRTNVTRFLTRNGHRVLEARDGQDALEVYERHPARIDVVVSDLGLPRVSGLALFEALRAKHASLPLIALSGSTDLELQRRIAELGAHVLVKPATPRELLKALELVTAGALGALSRKT